MEKEEGTVPKAAERSGGAMTQKCHRIWQWRWVTVLDKRVEW